MRPMARIPRQWKTNDTTRAAVPIPRIATSATIHRPSAIADTSEIAHPSKTVSVTTGAARNATGIRRGEAMCRSSARRAPTGARDPSRRPARRAAVGKSGCPAPSAGSDRRFCPPERGGHPIEDLPLDDEADAILRREDVLRDPERGPDAVLDRVVRLRADERLAARVDDDDDVAGPLPFILVRK